MSGPRTLIRRFWGVVPVALAVGLLAVRACLATPPLDHLRRVAVEPGDPDGTTAYDGYVMIARGGPVVIGFQSATPSHLVVGEHGKDLHGWGLVKERLVLPAGPAKLHFAAAPGARLVWNPVGRRGDPEYLPASSLAATADGFGHFIGATPLDGIIALALLATLVGSLLVLARARLRAVPSTTWFAMGAVFVVALAVRWLTADFGQTWDEDVNWEAGRNYITNLVSLDVSPGAWIWNYEHPPVMKYLDGIGAQLADGYGPARALSGVWSSLGCMLLVPIGARLYRVRVGVLAALIAALLPPLVAHGQIVGHESPTLLWWALAILLALGVHDVPERTRIRIVWVGVVIGVAVASRFVNALVGPLALAIVAIEAPPERRWRRVLEAAIAMPLVAFATFYVLWPRIWRHPIAMLQESLHKLSQTHSLEPFLGAMTNKPGPHYFVLYLVATLPVLVLVGVLAYGVRVARDRDRRHLRSELVLAAWFVIPLAVMASPVRQDGVRYVMPCVLALAMMAAAGWEFVAGLVEQGKRHVFIPLVAVLTVYLGITLVRIHPYYLDYFGEQVGGPSTVAAHGWFETAWWGEGVGKAVDYVNVHAKPGAKVFRNCIEPAHLAWFREDLWTPMTNNPAEADWIVTYSPLKTRCPIPAGMQKVLTVDAQGAPLAEVWQKP